MASKAGRPKYIPSDEHKDAAYRLAKKGCSNKEIADALEIGYSTFNRNIEQFQEAIKRGREETDESRIEQAENAFFKRVVGYEYDEVTTGKLIDEDGNVLKLLKEKTTKKQVMPDVTAGMFYKVNRAPDRWQSINKEKRESASIGDIANAFKEIGKSINRIDADSASIQE